MSMISGGPAQPKTFTVLILFLLSAIPIFSFQEGTRTEPAASTGAKALLGDWGVETRGISKTVKPGDDFFTYVNEGWIKSAKIPAGLPDYGASTEVGLKTEQRVNAIILDSVQGDGAKDDSMRRIAALYKSYLDTARIEKAGLAGMEGDLKHILELGTHQDVARWMADPRSSSVVAIYVFLDEGNTKRWLVHLDQINFTQSLLGLNGSDYSGTDETASKHRAAYLAYMAGTLQRAGIDNAQRRAADVMALETQIAAMQWSLERQRDRKANYHLMTRDELSAYAPGFPWDAFLTARHADGVKELVLGTDTAIQAQAALFAKTPVAVWSSYLAFHWMQNQIELLPASFRTASFDFYQRGMWNVKEMPTRERDALKFVARNPGEPIGKIYVERYFPRESLARAEELFGYLKRAFAERIAQAEWLDAATRAEAQAKLAAFEFKIGYPRVWRDFSQVSIREDDLLGNVRRLRDADWAHQLSRLNGPAHLVWNQTPQTVDASFSPQMNAVELPAAILQPPYFDPLADPAVNFGSIAAIIGHEMGHGFDDQGAVFDSHGNIRDWWTALSRTHFEERTNALVEQYNAFSPFEGIHVNGKLTLGENIGDLTGVSLAHRAYELYLRDHNDGKAPVLNGYSGDQRFFLSWAQTWQYVAPDWAIRYIITNGYHTPAMYRVNGVVRNIDAWYKAFGVTTADKLYLPPDARVKLW